MISNFQFFSTDGFILNLSPGVNTNFYAKNSSRAIQKYFSQTEIGIRWKFQNKPVSLLWPGQRLYGKPDPSMSKVIVLFDWQNAEFPRPDNGAIFNSDGTLHLKLKCPELVSDLALRNGAIGMKYMPEFPESLYLEGISWELNSNNVIVPAIRILYDREWLEIREVDVKTGTFGPCLSSGRL